MLRIESSRLLLAHRSCLGDSLRWLNKQLSECAALTFSEARRQLTACSCSSAINAVCHPGRVANGPSLATLRL